MNWIKQSLIFATILVVTFVLGDNLMYGLQRSGAGQSDLRVNFRHSAGADYQAAPPAHYVNVSNASLDPSLQRFRTGFYGEVLASDFDPTLYDGDCKLVFIGGSSTETRWVREDLRWVAQINAQTGPDVAAFNFGVGGQNMAQSLMRYSAYISSLRPNKVYVMHESNDISKFIKGGYDIREGSLHSLYDRQITHPSLYQRARMGLDILVPFTAQIWRSFRNKNHVPARAGGEGQIEQGQTYQGMAADAAAKIYLGRLLALNEIVTSHGAEMVVIEYPQIYGHILGNPSDPLNAPVRQVLVDQLARNAMRPAEFLTFVETFRRHMRAELDQRSIPVIDTGQILDPSYFYDAVHFNEAGSIHFADWLMQQIGPTPCQ